MWAVWTEDNTLQYEPLDENVTSTLDYSKLQLFGISLIRSCKPREFLTDMFMASRQTDTLSRSFVCRRRAM